MIPLFIKRAIMSAVVALAVPLAVTAQQTVFYDTFGSSTTNGVSTPGGTPTASSTSYDIGSAKTATGSHIQPGDFQLITTHSTSGSSEAQAVFTKFPVVLQATNDFIELEYTFIDTTDMLSGDSGNGVGLYCGLYNSGGVAPFSGAVLENGGFNSAVSTYALGGVQNWLGYYAQMQNSGTGFSDWSVGSRPGQTTLNDNDQQVLYNFPTGGSSHNSAQPAALPFPNLTPGATYTAQLRITYVGGGLMVSNAMYVGSAVGGSIVYTNIGLFTGANLLTTNFDSLAVGYRESIPNTDPSLATNDITSITVIAGLANQAGPYFTMTSSGNGCGGATLGLNGSVTTNLYVLFTNGVSTGQAILGTGGPLNFGQQTSSGNYMVIASNLDSGTEGPMYGNQAIYVGTPFFSSEPVSLTCVTNIPATFSVVGVGPSLTFQWYLNGNPLTNGGNISGALTTNLTINPTLAGNVGSYYCVAQDPCGDIFTSAPNASLTLIPPHPLVWQGGSDGNWDFTEANFLNSGVPASFSNGDDVTFDNTGNGGVDVTDLVTSTIITVNASQGYTFNGPGKITGFSQMQIGGSGGVTIGNLNDYTGGTIVSNGSSLTLGTGSGNSGTVAGIVTLAPSATLNYNYANNSSAGSDQIFNGFAGSGTVNVNEANNATIVSPLNQISSNFNGTINIEGNTSLHANGGNLGDPFGYGSTINVPDGAQIWLDNSSLAYNMTLNIAGIGWPGANPETGALRIYSCTFIGPINLLANARIGGSINGATIQSVISGPYQLEIYGNTNSFVLVMGPTNGSPQNYASTLITSGAISCASTNAVSTGLLTEDAGGDFQLSGHNITVANLTSINSGNVQWLAGPTVRNNNTTNAGVLTIGGDNNSEQYDGTFLDGAAASLGLTKIGSGTLRLTAVNTNSGPITVVGGSIALTSGGPANTTGAFTKASLISVNSGASFNVSGRSDDTLSLNANQRLAGNGTVTGNVVVNSGGILNPGLPTGTLNVSGSVTMNSGSTYMASVNRNNTPNCGKLSASGAITYAGTLLVTNVGNGLQANDSFQLFPGGNTSFSSIILETNDVANNLKYTWNNNVASGGQVSVASVTYLINPNPTNIVSRLSGTNHLVLSWPADHTGWTLQAQTNSVSKGLSTNWVTVSGSTTVNTVTNIVNPTNGTVFYRLLFTAP
jgi:autotransporter-associated beta strand protein